MLSTRARAELRVIPIDGCPASGAIRESLERLGALAPLMRLGSAEVRVEEPALLHLSLHDPSGVALGSLTVVTGTDCAARATLAAAVLAAFAGDWSPTEVSKPSAAPETPSVGDATRGRAERSLGPRWQAELAAMAFGVHDGDVAGLGFAARADLSRAGWLLTLLAEGNLQRERSLGQGQGAYRSLRAGLGLGTSRRASQLAWDGVLVPMLERLSLQGENLSTSNRAVTDWGFVVAAQSRLGWQMRALRPFLFVAASYAFPRQRLTLEGSPETVALSPVNLEAGLGISFVILP